MMLLWIFFSSLGSTSSIVPHLANNCLSRKLFGLYSWAYLLSRGVLPLKVPLVSIIACQVKHPEPPCSVRHTPCLVYVVYLGSLPSFETISSPGNHSSSGACALTALDCLVLPELPSLCFSGLLPLLEFSCEATLWPLIFPSLAPWFAQSCSGSPQCGFLGDIDINHAHLWLGFESLVDCFLQVGQLGLVLCLLILSNLCVALHQGHRSLVSLLFLSLSPLSSSKIPDV